MRGLRDGAQAPLSQPGRCKYADLLWTTMGPPQPPSTTSTGSGRPVGGKGPSHRSQACRGRGGQAALHPRPSRLSPSGLLKSPPSSSPSWRDPCPALSTPLGPESQPVTSRLNVPGAKAGPWSVGPGCGPCGGIQSRRDQPRHDECVSCRGRCGQDPASSRLQRGRHQRYPRERTCRGSHRNPTLHTPRCTEKTAGERRVRPWNLRRSHTLPIAPQGLRGWWGMGAGRRHTGITLPRRQGLMGLGETWLLRGCWEC